MSFRTYFDVTGDDRSGLGGQVAAQRARVAERLAAVRATVAVMSGKGGVGKSFITAGLARAAARRGVRVGVLDADLKSPTVARLLEASGPLRVTAEGVEPAAGRDGIRVMSSEFLLSEGRPLRWHGPAQDRFVWQGTLEAGALREFLGDVVWGSLDLLLIDLPPGADGVAEIQPLVPDLAGVVAVTIPSEESERSVARALRAATDAGVRTLGIVENMSGYRCAGCRTVSPLFAGRAGDALAEQFAVPLLARVPFDGRDPGKEPGPFEALAATLLEHVR